MNELFSKKWGFLRQYGNIIIEKAVGKMDGRMRKSLVFTGGTSLHLYSARLLFNDEPIRASEDADFFNRDSRLLENPQGLTEAEIAKAYARALGELGFKSECSGNIVLLQPHRIKAEFFYDARSFPNKTYSHGGMAIIHPLSLYRIKLGLLWQRESVSIRDLIDVLYLATKYGLPERIVASEKIDALLEWRSIADYLTQEGEEYFKRNDYQKMAANLLERVQVHEKD